MVQSPSADRTTFIATHHFLLTTFTAMSERHHGNGNDGFPYRHPHGNPYPNLPNGPIPPNHGLFEPRQFQHTMNYEHGHNAYQLSAHAPANMHPSFPIPPTAPNYPNHSPPNPTWNAPGNLPSVYLQFHQPTTFQNGHHPHRQLPEHSYHPPMPVNGNHPGVMIDSHPTHNSNYYPPATSRVPTFYDHPNPSPLVRPFGFAEHLEVEANRAGLDMIVNRDANLGLQNSYHTPPANTTGTFVPPSAPTQPNMPPRANAFHSTTRGARDHAVESRLSQAGLQAEDVAQCLRQVLGMPCVSHFSLLFFSNR